MDYSIVQIIIAGLIGGFFINLCDVSVTVAFAAREWAKVLENQGINSNKFTPPYYVSASFVAGIVLAWTIVVLAFKYGLNPVTGVISSLFLYGISRLYGAGHVVMRQMPLKIFTIMSSGLLLGFLVAGQVIVWYFGLK
jgi:uncharacterized protein involved in cysteine biosynthesis